MEKNKIDYIKLSKEVSYALRHAPWEYELELNDEGFVSIEQLLNSINESHNYDRKITKEDLLFIINNSDKKRHEIVGDQIRALYGHSVVNKIIKQESKPPLVLYHGTTHKALKSIMINGLLPMKRQYVHLSANKETALKVGSRRDNNPILLEIDSNNAFKEGIIFYIGNDNVWLCNSLPSKYIKIL